MTRFKSHPVFFSILIALGVVLVGEFYFVYRGFSVTEEKERRLENKQRELSMLLSANPRPAQTSRGAIEKDLERTKEALEKMRESLRGVGEVAEALRADKVPSDSVKMFFDISSFVDATREKAAAAGITIGQGEQFGFGTYANGFPNDTALIPPVFLQRQIIKYLVDALIEAKPKSILWVQRELVRNNAVEAARAALRSSRPQQGAVGDFFEIDPAITASVGGFVNAHAFRVAFEGETDCIRKFMNKIASFELPLVVRSVEVEPVGKAKSGTGKSLAAAFGIAPKTPAPGDGKPVPIVGKSLSRFTVTIELINLVAKDDAPKS